MMNEKKVSSTKPAKPTSKNNANQSSHCCNDKKKISQKPLSLILKKGKKLSQSLTFWQITSFALAWMLIFNTFFETKITSRNIFSGLSKTVDTNQDNVLGESSTNESVYASAVLPENGIVLPATWGNLGTRMVEAGVIDKEKFEKLYIDREGYDENEQNLLRSSDNGQPKIDKNNANVMLNIFWALGLGNKNLVLDQGPMQESGDPSRFASTGGWTLSTGEPMNHYSKHDFITLTPDQQTLVENVAKNIYRPCCGNSTYFPDCNHGMAMLGLLEFLASQSVSENEMYRVALQVNSYWFPDTYQTLAKYFEMENVTWKDVDAKVVLGKDYSSSAGYKKVLEKVNPVRAQGGGGCGV